jgi:flagellin-specific chaperone FliS
MTSALQAYRRSSLTQWTRIDLLVALYQATERSLNAGAAAIDRQNLPEIAAILLKVQKQILAIIEGIDDSDDTASNVKRLLTFCLGCVASRQAPRWRDAARIVGELRAAFEAIQDVGRAMESRGEIAPIDMQGSRAIVA